MTKEALKLALEALEANQPVNYCMNSNGERFPMMHEDPFRFERNTKAITAIKAALEAKDEPVACADNGVVNWIADKQFMHEAELYIAPPQRTWVGLTKKEFEDAVYRLEDLEDCWVAIETKLKGKNT
jgi:hypothetical protein